MLLINIHNTKTNSHHSSTYQPSYPLVNLIVHSTNLNFRRHILMQTFRTSRTFMARTSPTCCAFAVLLHFLLTPNPINGVLQRSIKVGEVLTQKSRLKPKSPYIKIPLPINSLMIELYGTSSLLTPIT